MDDSAVKKIKNIRFNKSAELIISKMFDVSYHFFSFFCSSKTINIHTRIVCIALSVLPHLSRRRETTTLKNKTILRNLSIDFFLELKK